MADDIIICESPEDINRCQAVTSQGQCMNKAVPEGTNCRVHGGNKQQESANNKAVRNYQLTLLQARFEKQATSPRLKTLTDEIGILRLTLENRLNMCKDNHDFMMASHSISDLVVKIEKLVTSCNKLDGQMGEHLDKQALLEFASKVISVIANVLEGDDARIGLISDGIMKALGDKVGLDAKS